ncbi:hypothetical protein BD779DRAFT_816332 [Infundibulicybe gibba]|nr:hypothetical protein BD779DRAFT_816332 [Infundibulicybe gibba]
MLDVLRSILRVTKSIVAVTRHFAFSKRHYFQWWPRVPVSALRRRQKKPLVHPSPPAHCIVSDLPPEILREIFLHCILLPGKWGSFSSRDTPLVLIKVCREWREVAVSTPELWSVLPFLRMYPRLGGDHLQLLFESYLKYSARAALSVRLDLPQHPNDDPSLLLITPYLSRSQHLSIVYFDDFSDLQPFIARTHLPILKTLELELTCRTAYQQRSYLNY